MKILDVINSIGITINNEEKQFLAKFGDSVSLTSLDERETWLAQNLVRKGLYEISNAQDTIIRVKNVFDFGSDT